MLLSAHIETGVGCWGALSFLDDGRTLVSLYNINSRGSFLIGLHQNINLTLKQQS